MRYFLCIEYVYLGSPVQRVRFLLESFADCLRKIRDYSEADYLLLSARVERCS